MDFKIATLIALFYDYPIEEIFNNLDRSIGKSEFLKPVSMLLRLRMPEYSIGDCKLWVDGLSKRWETTYKDSSAVYASFVMLSEFCQNLIDPHNFTIKTQNLIEWNFLTRMLSEDFITCCVKANTDVLNGTKTNNFNWENFKYDNDKLEDFLSKPLYDVHAHIDSSSDAFDLTWIICMNRLELEKGKKVLFDENEIKLLYVSQEKTLKYWEDKTVLNSYLDLIALAAVLRYIIYEFVTTSNVSVNLIKLSKLTPDGVLSLFNKYKEKIDIARHQNSKKYIYKSRIWDYAMNGIDQAGADSAQFLFAGERKIIYDFFLSVFSSTNTEKMRKICSIFHLYQLIKMHIRREIIHTNGMDGLSNYQDYQSNYDQFKIDDYNDLYLRYALQKAIGYPMYNYYYEGRISPSNLKDIQQLDVSKSILNPHSNIFPRVNLQQITLVGCISKSLASGSSNREYVKFRTSLNEKLNELLEIMHRNPHLYKVGKLKSSCSIYYKTVGVDFAGSDRKMRPEIFTQFIRSARLRKITHFTYHAGEDFYDLLDGLRTIDEIICFLNWNDQCRLGHALALFTNASYYYEKHHHVVIIPKQILLDNLVWFLENCEHIQGCYKNELIKKVQSLYHDIGFPLDFNLTDYTKSIKMRGNTSVLNSFTRIADFKSNTVKAGEKKFLTSESDNSFKLFEYYLTNPDCLKNGNQIEVWYVPNFVENQISHLQNQLKNKLIERNIAVECCPTSNMLIGCMRDFSDLSIIRNKMKGINFSINTDSSGIFDTTLRNEYALIFSILKNKGNSDEHAIGKLERFREASRVMRF